MPENIGTEALSAVEKALTDLPLITKTISSFQSTLTNDQHASFLQNTLDLLGVAGTSADALATSGTVGTADAQHIQAAVAAVDTTVATISPFSSLFNAAISGIKNAFSGIHW